MAMLKLRLACESHAHFKIFRAIAVSGVAAILVMGLASVAATSALVAGPPLRAHPFVGRTASPPSNAAELRRANYFVHRPRPGPSTPTIAPSKSAGRRG